MKPSSRKESILLKQFIEFLNEQMIPLKIIDTCGNQYATEQKNIKYQLHIKDSKFVNALIRPSAHSFGEAYIKGYFDVSGSIRELYEIACDRLLNMDQRKRMLAMLLKPFADPWKKEKENIEYHYNVPSSFYRHFLGETMGYTCGYYTSETAGMTQAQNEKMDIICRKLRLKPDEKLLDIGCGWGNFAVFAARHYRARVTGITLSSEQKSYAEEWIEKEGLTGRIRIKLMNYRDLGAETFHKISCIGMSEHVGSTNMPGFFKTVYNCLKKGGLFMQHTIVTNQKRKKGYENAFLEKYMFPGGELVREQDLIGLALRTGFELLNAENFRPHYVKTLNDWIVRMEAHRDQLLRIVSENVYRIYHVFFIGSLISFRKKEISLFQNLFYKTDADDHTTDRFLSAYSANEKRLA